MKSIFKFLAMALCVSLYSCSTTIDEPVSGKKLNVSTPGTLKSLLTTDEKLTITKLTLTGTIDARDIKYLRDSMPLLADLDLSAVAISAYAEKVGTIGSVYYEYPANGLPDAAFEKFLKDSTTLKSIVLPSTLTSIGVLAFDCCTGLSSISIPESVTSIANGAFADCSGLKSFIIPPKVTSIELSVFRNCTGLTSITIPNSVTTIRSYAFSGCSSLKSISIPESVTLISINMFVGCSSLTSISVGAASNYISTADGVLFSKDKTVLVCCPGGSLGTYTIPASVTTIEYGAFSGCTGLNSIIIPVGVTSIKSYAFQNCTNLTSIYAYSVKPIDLNASISPFVGVNTTTCILHIPVGSKSNYQTANEWKEFANIVEN